MSLISIAHGPGMSAPRGHYSQAIIGNGLAFISGQLPISTSGQILSDIPFDQQARLTLANVSAVLSSCGAELGDLAQVRVYLDDVQNWKVFDSIYSEWIGPWKPARAVVPVSTLHYGAKIEIEAIAITRSP